MQPEHCSLVPPRIISNTNAVPRAWMKRSLPAAASTSEKRLQPSPVFVPNFTPVCHTSMAASGRQHRPSSPHSTAPCPLPFDGSQPHDGGVRASRLAPSQAFQRPIWDATCSTRSYSPASSSGRFVEMPSSALLVPVLVSKWRQLAYIRALLSRHLHTITPLLPQAHIFVF